MEYYYEEAKKLARKLQELRKDDSLIFPIFTDLHSKDALDNAITELQTVFTALSSEFDITALLALGDNLAMLGREHHASNEEIHQLISLLFTQSASHWDRPLFAVNGNHDGIGTDFFDKDFWYDMIGDKFDRGQAVREDNSAYFYVDYPKSKLRMVCLSLPSGCDLSAEYPTPLWEYGTKQLQWLASTALNTEFPVLLVAHVPFYYDYTGDNTVLLGVFDGKQGRQSPIAALCGWIADREIAEQIFDSFQNHMAYDNNELNIHLAPSAPSAKLIACLSGHMHTDGFIPAKEVVKKEASQNESKLLRNTLPCPQFVTRSTNGKIIRDYQPNTPVISLDIAVVTPSERQLTMLRFGQGEDRKITW